MNDLRVLYAFGYVDESAGVVAFLKNKMVAELTAAGRTVGRIETVPTKPLVEERLDTEDFNLLIVREDLGPDKISSGSLKAWSQRYPNLQVILCVGDDKKGGEKLRRLVSSAPFYYNALYENDLTGSNIEKLLVASRTKEEAICYYGLEQKMEPKVEQNLPEADDRENKISYQQESIDLNEKKEGSIEVPDTEVLKDELEEAISAFEAMETEVFENKDFEAKEIEEDSLKVKEVSFDYEEMFSGDKLFGSSYKESKESDEEKILPDRGATSDKGTALENTQHLVQEDVKDLYKWEQSFTKESVEMLPESGKVLRVLDHNTMLLEMGQSPVLTQGKTLEDYKLLFVVKGTKGSFVDGKYRVGVKSFEGYAGSLLGPNTVIVEVPAYDLIENKLEGAECSIICISQLP